MNIKVFVIALALLAGMPAWGAEDSPVESAIKAHTVSSAKGKSPVEEKSGLNSKVKAQTGIVEQSLVKMIRNQTPDNCLETACDLFVSLVKNRDLIDKDVFARAYFASSGFLLYARPDDVFMPLLKLEFLKNYKNEAAYGPGFSLCGEAVAEEYLKEQEFGKAAVISTFSYKSYVRLFGRENTQLKSLLLFNLSYALYMDKQYDFGMRMYADKVACDRALFGPDSEYYRESLRVLSSYGGLVTDNETYEKALSAALTDIEKYHKSDLELYRETLANLGGARQSLGRMRDAAGLYSRALEMTAPSDSVYLDLLSRKCEVHHDLGDNRGVEECLDKALSAMESGSRPGLHDIYTWSAYLNEYGTDKTFSRLLNALDRCVGKDDVNAGIVRAACYAKMGQIEKSYKLLDRLRPLPEDDTIDLSYLESLYLAQGNFDDLIPLYEEEVRSAKELVGESHPLHIRALMVLANVCSMSGDNARAREILDRCAGLNSSDSSLNFEIRRSRIDLELSLGNYQYVIDESRRLIDSAPTAPLKYSLMKNVVGAQTGLLDVLYRVNGGVKKVPADVAARAVDDAEALRNFAVSEFGEGSENESISEFLLAGMYSLAGRTDKIKEILPGLEKSIGQIRKPSLKKSYQCNMAAVYLLCGMPEKAYKSLDMASLDNPNALFEEKAYIMQMKSECLLRMGRMNEARSAYLDFMDMMLADMSDVIGTMTSRERMNYWQKVRTGVNICGQFAERDGRQSEFAGKVYNLALYGKNLLLESERQFVSAVRATGDENLITKLRALEGLRSTLSQEGAAEALVYEMKRGEADRLERELLKAVGSSMPVIAPADWRKIYKEMPSDALAVEMIEYENMELERQYYGAVVLRKDMDFPAFVEIGERDKIDSLLSQAEFTAEQGEAAWGKLAPYLDGIASVYISPAGVFHSVPFEYYPYGDVSDMSERYRIFRVSTTARIALPGSAGDGKGAAVYGGLDYGLSPELMAEDARMHAQRSVGADVCDDSVRGLIRSLSPLPGTESEARSIASALGETADLYLGAKGTEASFKALERKHLSVIHIGTHGFYVPAHSRAIGSSPLFAQTSVSAEDVMLTHCGLLMAGAGSTLRGNKVSEGVDDGILTAKEIAALDLSGVDLVTLSACETGRGDVTGDGVFGLQRGFKLAGADTIMMSLWKVSDAATAKLMSEFYANITKGMDKCEALKEARRCLKATPEFSSPSMWGAFVLLDAE